MHHRRRRRFHHRRRERRRRSQWRTLRNWGIPIVLLVGILWFASDGWMEDLFPSEPAPTPALVSTPTSAPTPTLALVSTSTSAPTPTPTLVSTPTPSPTPTPVPTLTSMPTPTPTLVSTPAPTPTPTPTPIPTPTPTPTPIPDPTVRVIYATPSDRKFNPTYAEAVEQAVSQVQQWYADQLEGDTFVVETPVPQHCTLSNRADYYARENGWDRVIAGLQHCAQVTYPSIHTIWVIYPDVDFDCDHSELGRGGYGVTILHRGDLDGLVNPSTYDQCGYGPRGEHGWVGGLAHELGHAFGLEHPPGCDEGLETCDEDTLMWAGYAYDFPDTILTDIDIAKLEASPFLHSN